MATGNVFLLSPDGALLHGFDGSEPGERFGQAIAVASVTQGERVAAVFVGAPLADGDEGSAAGRAVLLAPDGAILRDFTGSEAGAQFGAALAAGSDFNGDGEPDLLVGAPLANSAAGSDAGTAALFSGDGRLLGQFGGLAAGDHLGRNVVLAPDLTAAGRSDLLLGAALAGSAGEYLLYTSVAAALCPGDCDANFRITIDELIRLVNARGQTGSPSCGADRNEDGALTLAELLADVTLALTSCR